MGCGKRATRAGERAFPPRSQARFRAEICNHASPCGTWCERLVKGYGLRLVYCGDASTGEKTPLREMLENPEAACPRGFW